MTRSRPDLPKAGTPAAKARRELRVDLTGLTEDQRRARADMMDLAVTAYGPGWKTPLATALSALRKVTVTPTQVAAWVSGARPVPQAVLDVLPELATIMAVELAFRAETLRGWPCGPAAPAFAEPRPVPTTAETIRELLDEDD